MRRLFGSALLMSVVLLAACEDEPFDPCAELGCGVEGVDLALAVAEVEWSGDQPFDDRVDTRLVEPGDELVFRYHLVNRGSQTSEPAVLFVGTWHNESNLGVDFRFVEWIEVPALEPGESFRGRVTKMAPTTGGLAVDQFIGEIRIESQTGPFFGDTEFANNYAAFDYHVAVPVVFVDFEMATDTLRLGAENDASFEVRNVSPVGAALAAGTPIQVCLIDTPNEYGTRVCRSDYLDWVPLPALPAGESITITTPLALPAEVPLYPATAEPTGVRACVGKVCDAVDAEIAW